MAQDSSQESIVQALVPIITSRHTQRSSPASSSPSSSSPSSSCFKMCSKLKGAMLLLMWNVIVGGTYGFVIYGLIGLTTSNRKEENFAKLLHILLGSLGIIALLQVLFYPLGGLIADVCFGRYKIVTLSILQIWCGFLFLSITGVLYPKLQHGHKSILAVTGGMSAILFIGGFTCFQANAVQFGLDQLLDSSSDEMSEFLHWYVWTDYLGEMITRMIGTSLPCNDIMDNVVPYLPLPFLTVITVLAVLTFLKKKWLHSEPHTRNPYGIIYRVLKFAAKHDRPLRRSAMTYCDDEMPTRLDYAKQRFGGPFTTEVVEDVKTFLRILAMLCMIGPIFYLNVTTSYVFPLLGIHLGKNHPPTYQYGCKPDWMLWQSGGMYYIISVLTIPLYVFFFRSYATRYFPSILSRLFVGVVLMVSSISSMFLLLVVGTHLAINKKNITDASCMFVADVRAHVKDHNHTFSQTLEFHASTLLIPNVLTGLAAPLIYITILEFISAQSPHTMKGLLLGVFYAVKGFFIMLGCVVVFPFSIKKFWTSQGTIFDCGFYYFLMTILCSFVVVMVILVAIRWYHYRDREDRPYGPSYVEDYYQRYTTGPRKDEQLRPGHIDTSILTYGTMDGVNP